MSDDKTGMNSEVKMASVKGHSEERFLGSDVFESGASSFLVENC